MRPPNAHSRNKELGQIGRYGSPVGFPAAGIIAVARREFYQALGDDQALAVIRAGEAYGGHDTQPWWLGPVSEPDRRDAVGGHPVSTRGDVISGDGRKLRLEHHPPPAAGVSCQDVCPPGAIGAADFQLGMSAGVPRRVHQLQLQHVGERVSRGRARS